MAEQFEEFDDFKVAEEAIESENVIANTIVAKELDRHFNWLYRFFEQSQSGKALGKIHNTKSELYQQIVNGGQTTASII